MPEKSYNKKIDHNLGIPLQDDYFYDEPEETIETKQMKEVESEVKLSKKIKTKKEKKVINADVLIIGAGISGMQAALDTGDKGYKVVIIEKTSTIGGSMVKLDKTFPTNDCSICTAAPKMVELSRHPNIELITYAELNSLEGKKGDFKAQVWKKSKYVDPDKCTGCNDCAEVCPVDVYYGSVEKKIPTVSYGDDCFFCGACIIECPEDAIILQYPLYAQPSYLSD